MHRSACWGFNIAAELVSCTHTCVCVSHKTRILKDAAGVLEEALVVTKEVPRSRGARKEVLKMFCQRDYKVRTEDAFFF